MRLRWPCRLRTSASLAPEAAVVAESQQSVGDDRVAVRVSDATLADCLIGATVGSGIASLITGFAFALAGHITASTLLYGLAMFWLIWMLSLPFCLLAAGVYFAPLFLLADRLGWSGWAWSIAIGLAPACAVLLVGARADFSHWLFPLLLSLLIQRKRRQSGGAVSNEQRKHATECVQTHSNPEADPREPDA